MATVTKFQDYSEQLARGVHAWATHTYKVALSNVAPNVTDTSLSQITQITAANGYVAGGATTTITLSETGGTTTISGTLVSWTATGGAMATFRYLVLYNDSATSPADALVQFWDLGAAGAVTLADGESYTFRFNGASPGTITTVA